eukprot:CAMPEP_0201918814 /NCGR_PEP_ID=MMETSP0903-20130614/7867_1 /ASSEMBLY_ACC=CAM_ASM_000552 /TAXON_ID=420261 /ORGANISM="Thalassiosira antarctica, Strain CCMP982" /LENGTH=758 /DNA_ID=CAMNT_0048455199 /DNA_START=167 /DNA_END=2440 /DNA_ORIENTATION=+
MHDPSQQPGPTDTYWDDFLRNGREPRRNREPVRVDYMGRHPFERSSQPDDTQNARQAQSVPGTTDNDAVLYEPMRVHFDTHLLDALSTDYPSHVSYIRDVLLPSLRSFWSEALSIIPAKQIEVPLSGPSSWCAQEVKKLTGFGLDDFLQQNATDSNHVEMGSGGSSLVYNETDLVVIVIPVEGTFICPESQGVDSQKGTLAFATNCQRDQLDRPTVGFAGICFGPLDPENNSTKTTKRRFLTMAHEFTHILGFNSQDVPFFYNHATGKPRTPRDQWNRPPRNEVLCVDGTNRTVTTASEDTLKQVTTANGQIAYEIVTETVRNVARNQFNCQKVAGGRLENQPTGENDCFGSHWDLRLYNNDIMAAVYTGSTQYITALTLAFLEDTGWYRPNYAVAENSPFGLGAGCEFVEDQCIQNGTVPKWADGTFCSSTSSVGCTTDKHLIAFCDISNWPDDLPSEYQYFEDPSLGSVLQQRDFCPAYTTIYRFELNDDSGDIPELDCTDSNLDGTWVQEKGEVFGEDSRCIEHASGARPICLEVICGEDGEDTGKVVLVVEGERMRCSYAGEMLQLPSGTDVTCPPFEQTCPESICPANCAGRGICVYSLSPAQCECFDRSNASPFCAELPWSSTPTIFISPAPTQSASSSAAPTDHPTRASPSSTAPAISTGLSTSPPTPNLSASPTKILMAKPSTLQSKAPITDSPTAAPVIDSPTDTPMLKPTEAEVETMPETPVPSSGAFQPGMAASLFFGGWWGIVAVW